MTTTLVAIAPSRESAIGVSDVRGGTAVDEHGHAVDLRAWRVAPLGEALVLHHDTDAHFAPYVLLGADGRPGDAQPRLNVSSLAALRAHGLDVRSSVWAADLDRPGHAPWSSGEAATAAAHALVAALPPGHGCYLTSRGARVLTTLSHPLPVGDLFVAMLRGWLLSLTGAAAAAGLQVDMSCAQWNRLYRLPHVRRDGTPTVAPFLLLPTAPLDPATITPSFPPAPPPLPSSAAPGSAAPPPPDRVVAYIKAFPAAIEGEFGSTQTLKAAIALVKGFDVPPDQALALLKAHYNPRCVPPWSDRDLARKVKEAARSRTPVGYLNRPPVRVSRETLKDLATTWSRTMPTYSRALKAIVRGEPYDSSLTTSLVRAIMFALPEADPASIAELFGASHGVMPAIGPVDIEGLARDWGAAAPPPVTMGAIEERTDEPYLLLTPVGDALYLRVGNDWIGPAVGRDAPDVMIGHYLSSTIELFTHDGKPKTKRHLIRQYGHVVKEHRIVLGATQSTYDPRSETFSEAQARPRVFDAQYSEAVNRYITALAGNAMVAQDINTWLAMLPDLTTTLASLVIVGRRGIGKSLLAAACARLWSDKGPSRAVDVFSDWTGSILRCPLVFADEYLPKGLGMSGRIREFVASHTHTITRKFLPSVEAIGCSRLIIAGNNDNILSFGENLNAEDLAAIAERFYLVHAHATGIDPETARRFVDEDELAKHCLWLNRNMARTRHGRFWIRGMSLDTLALQGGARSEVCRWIHAWRQQPDRLRMSLGGAVPKSDPVMLAVALPEISNGWATYVDTPRPSLSEIRLALSILGERVNDRRWRVSEEKIDTWAAFYA